MLKIKNISKRYQTGGLIQDALKNINLNFRDNEFVSILGPSGSGKTTLLNIIGGLDRYDSGDLIINGISTKEYKDSDWDFYRNHSIGFVFQSYNLIPHQSVLENVELSLTISGISKKERIDIAKKALNDVGLFDQINKKPNQLSGGQMQRVAIARALVNNPDILLADEPTGALDTETSVQVMELLKAVSKDRLVIMVTHNPELAQKYSSRIVKLRDGEIISDSNPYEINITAHKKENKSKSSMSFLTSLSLSFKNLLTKKGRTLLTSFAGSIGIALILALSNGVNVYINDIQKNTMGSYPITINEESMDLNKMMKSEELNTNSKKVEHPLNAVYSNGSALGASNKTNTSSTKNNLTKFKEYLDNPNSKIHKYLGETGIIYSYNVPFDTYCFDKNDTLVNTDGSTLTKDDNENKEAPKSAFHESMAKPMIKITKHSDANSDSSNTFEEMIPDKNNNSVSDIVKKNYNVVYGNWPKNYNEVVLVLNENNEISLSSMYKLGLLPSNEYDDLMKSVENKKNFKAKSYKLDYNEILSKTFYLVPSCDYYTKNKNGTFTSIKDDKGKVSTLAKESIKLKVCGIIRPVKDADNAMITSTLGYTKN